VRLRRHADPDLEEVARASLDPEVLRWTLVPDDNSAEAMAAWISDWRARGEELHLLVVDASTDELLGAIGVVDADLAQDRCGIGYWLAPHARGRGSMARAVRLLTAWCFEELGVQRVEIRAEPANAASRAVAERAGFTFEGIARSWFTIKGRRADAAVYSQIADG